MKISKSLNRIKLRYRAIKAHPLTEKSYLRGLYRYLFFNLSQSIIKKPKIYNWVNGLKFYAEKGDAGLVGNIYYELMDYEDSMFLMEYLKPDDIFIDVGANLGHYTMLASGVCRSKTIAIEPIASTLVKLKKNIELNNLQEKVTLLNIGIGDKNEILNFTTNKTVMNSVSLVESNTTVKIEVKTLDTVLKNINPTFIKIDVEGYEYKVLKGAANTLKNYKLKYLLVEFNESGSVFDIKDEEVFNLIIANGFTPIRYNPSKNEIVAIRSYNKDKFNTLFIRNEHA